MRSWWRELAANWRAVRELGRLQKRMDAMTPDAVWRELSAIERRRVGSM